MRHDKVGCQAANITNRRQDQTKYVGVFSQALEESVGLQIYDFHIARVVASRKESSIRRDRELMSRWRLGLVIDRGLFSEV